jgi:hypothetical protein
LQFAVQVNTFFSPEVLRFLFVIVFSSLIKPHIALKKGKGKGLPQQAEVAQEVPGRLKPRILLTFCTTGVVGRQPYAPVAFTQGEIPGTGFRRLSRPQGTWFCQ